MAGSDPKPAADGGFAKSFKMARRLAYRNLFHDRLSLFVTLVGIVFSVVLVAIQCGMYIASERMISAVLDQTKGELWIVPLGTRSFDDPSFLAGREKYAALSAPGVDSVEDLVVGFAMWRKPKGGSTTVLVVGSNWKTGGLEPWNVRKGSLEELAAPGAVAVDQTYFTDLGVNDLGDVAELNNQKVRVAAVTQGIRSFTTLPYIFTTLGRAQALLDAAPEQASYALVRVTPGTDVESLRKVLSDRLPDNEILTREEFRSRSLGYWLFQTGAGGALIAGAVLGLIVGVVIVAQTLYASTKDHLNEFATLRALGAPAHYIHLVILIQAIVSALIGYALGMVLSLAAIWAFEGSPIPVVMTPGLAAALFGVTIGMCTFAAMSAIVKVTRIDPAGVFSR